MVGKNYSNWYVLGMTVVALYFLPFLILGEESIIFIHDNLEISFIQRTILARNGLPLSPDFLIEEVMNGLPRAYYPSSLSIVNIFFLLFTPFSAYVLNELLVRLVAYTGMYLLLNKYILENRKYKTHITIVGSLSFALIQFYSIQGLTIAGQPLLAYAFLNLLNERRIYLSYILICLYALYSYMVYSTIFILLMLLLFIIFKYIKTKKIPKKFLFGFFLLGGVSLLVEYNLMIQILNPNYVSNRSDFVVPALSMNGIKDLVYSKYIVPYHAGAFDPIWIIITFCLSIITYNRIAKTMQTILLSILMLFCSVFVATFI
ncbi:MAG: DUF6044 family protein, partial [Allomuricauda sp.]